MDSRADFESAVKDQWSDSFNFKRGIDSFYVDETLSGMWWGWRVSRRVLSSRQALEGEPLMWSLQFDNGPVNHFTTYPTLEKAEDYATLCNIGKDKSDINIIPLYTHPARAVVPDAEYLRVLQDAFDIIQADANTERNYGSMCQIGSVLATLKSEQDKPQ